MNPMLATAVVYDVEVLPNCFTVTAETLYGDNVSTWEISEFRDDRQQLLQFLDYCFRNQIVMIGFNNVGYDLLIVQHLFQNPSATYADLYAKNQEIFAAQQDDRFGMMIWANDRFAPQCDLYLINHFNNKSKRTSLKALQVNMRSLTVVDSPVQWGVPVTREQIDRDLIPYNIHDVRETKRFAHMMIGALEFRVELIEQFGIDVLNYNDVKIGVKMLEQRLGDEVCYDRSSGRRRPRQTPRNRIPLADIIFPYIKFENPEFARILEFMRSKVLTPDDLDDPDAKVKTKGVLTASAHVGGIEFHFGTGGVHASVEAQRFVADDTWLIRDIDVEGLYPSVSRVNRLAPAHLGERFISEYEKLPEERKQHAKGTGKNALFKLAANGAWGQSNMQHGFLYDPQYAMTIPINGQLMICMLAEQLVKVPTLQLIQANTDGITYRIHRDYEPYAVQICDWWQSYTRLKLEDVSYRRMWIRDVNNYVAEDLKGKLKQKGAYWHPDPHDYANSISNASPPSWHKDLSNIVSIRAAVAAMVHGIDPETYIRLHTDPFDFMIRAKVERNVRLMLGDQEIQRTSRYYVARQGAALTKIAPPKGPIGEFKRANKIPDDLFEAVMREIGPGVWDARIHTKNKSRYEQVVTSFEAGWVVAECNDARHFRFDNVNYDFYINEARKLIVT